MKKYFKGWHRYFREPTEEIAEDEAQQRHEANGNYVVVAYDDKLKPLAFIEFGKGDYGVCFLDDKARVQLSYTFQEVEGNKLFLSQAAHREFVGDENSIKSGTAYFFTEDGDVTIERMKEGGTRTTETGKTEVSQNWEEIPRFGDFSRLLIRERGSEGS